jgi:cell division cycle 14
LYFVSLRVQPKDYTNAHFFTVDQDFVYESFFADFGPLNLGHVYTFCEMLDKKLSDVRFKGKKLFMYTSYDATKRSNAAFLIGAYCVRVHSFSTSVFFFLLSFSYSSSSSQLLQVIKLRRSPEEVYLPFSKVSPSFLPFRDASAGISTYNLTLLDCWRGLAKAIACGFFDPQTFNVQE